MADADTDLHTLTIEPAPGAHLVVDRLPGADPPLVFLHGLASIRAGEKSRALFELARRRGRGAWRFDFRGHGGSSGTLGAVPLSHLVADAAAVLERSGPAHLVGSSLGGLVASWVAARHPRAVVSLTLIAPALGFLGRLLARRDAASGRATLDRADGAVVFESAVLDDLAEHDETALAAAIRCPTLVFHGDRDDVVPLRGSEELVAALRAAGQIAELRPIPGGDHRLNVQIDALLAIAADFHGY
ncbi:MAG: alpha/beta fold hydrolase [Planctomycetes bacterium]|nr:alpha/beta fold hydrolase [Planctomycetota bacterium]